MNNVAKMTQIDGLTAGQIFEAFKCLEQKIETLKAPAPVQKSDGYLTRQEVSKLLKVSAVTVHDWTNKGFLKAYRLGQKGVFQSRRNRRGNGRN